MAGQNQLPGFCHFCQKLLTGLCRQYPVPIYSRRQIRQCTLDGRVHEITCHDRPCFIQKRNLDRHVPRSMPWCWTKTDEISNTMVASNDFEPVTIQQRLDRLSPDVTWVAIGMRLGSDARMIEICLSCHHLCIWKSGSPMAFLMRRCPANMVYMQMCAHNMGYVLR